jgi:signal peptidase
MSGRRVRRGLGYYVGLGLSWGLLGLVLGLAAILIFVPAAGGATPLTVLTSSMEPHLPPGTFIVVRPTPVDDIHIGSVVTYQIESGKPEVITHRVVEIRSESNGSVSFITKGDNNDDADPKPVIPEQIKGTLWYSVPLIGYLATAVNGQSRSWLVPVAGVGLLVYAAVMVVSALVARARKRAGRQTGRRAAEKP